jgi:hypothetical protein
VQRLKGSLLHVFAAVHLIKAVDRDIKTMIVATVNKIDPLLLLQ